MGFLLTRVAAALGAGLAGLLAASMALPGEAAAATLPPAVSAQIARSQLIQPLLAADAPTQIKADYTCDFSAYGNGIQAATVSFTAAVTTPWPVNQPDDITLDNDAITLPSTVTSQLTGVNAIEVTSQVSAKHATKATIDLSGAALVDSTSSLTEIPDITTLGRVTFAAKGSDGSVALPAQSITIKPMAGTAAKPVITCTTTAPAQDVAITVGDASGPFYHCTSTVAGQSPDESAGLVPLTITETGTEKTGDSLTISITSTDVAKLLSTAETIVAAAGTTIDKATFSADLAVTGAQSGTLHITKTITDLSAATFSASGTLKLTKKGTVKIDIPSKFGLALSASATVVLDLACTLVTTPAPVALTLTVAQGPAPTPSPTPSATSDNGDTDDTGATTEPTGTPVGGAATGGGVTPGGDMPLVLGGAALALAGGGLLLARATAPRRRKARTGDATPGPATPEGPSDGSKA
jgi:hypothetical protein